MITQRLSAVQLKLVDVGLPVDDVDHPERQEGSKVGH